ncbi:MAG: hypothetical protein AB1610_09555 [Nitrospirota bacterium]
MNPIKVISYSGYKGEERPEAFFINGEKITVVEILHMWIEENIAYRHRKRFFRIKGSDCHEYKIFYDETRGEWFL